MVSPRDILRPAIEQNGMAIVCLHNHPSGNCSPSREDADFTRKVKEATSVMGLRLLDHLVIGRPTEGHQGYYSFADEGAL